MSHEAVERGEEDALAREVLLVNGVSGGRLGGDLVVASGLRRRVD